MCDVTHSSHYSLLSLFTQLHNSILQGLRGVAVTDYLDYDEDYYAPGYYDEDYDLDFEEEPFDADFFDDEDLDSDMELYNPRQGGRMNPHQYKDGRMNRAFRQLQNNGRISSGVARNLSSRDIRSVIRANGLRVRDTRITRNGAVVVRRTMGRVRGLPRTYYYD